MAAVAVAIELFGGLDDAFEQIVCDFIHRDAFLFGNRHEESKDFRLQINGDLECGSGVMKSSLKLSSGTYNSEPTPDRGGAYTIPVFASTVAIITHCDPQPQRITK